MGRIGGDVTTSIEKSKWELIGGMYTLSVTGKEMDSNPDAAGIYITTSSDYVLDVKTNLSQSTISGIMSMKSGDTLNMKSVKAMTINSEANIAESATTTITSTAGTVYTIMSGGGSPTATNKVDINPE